MATLSYPEADIRTSGRYQEPDWEQVRCDLRRKGVTKQLLWEEYTEQYPNRCYSYSQFCDRYLKWRGRLNRSMRQTHKAGEKCFIDYCGPTRPIVSPSSGEVRQAKARPQVPCRM